MKNMKKLLLPLLLPAGLMAMQQPPANAYQELIGRTILSIKNKTNNNYRITTSQRLENGQLVATPNDQNHNPLDSGLPAKSEKRFTIVLNPEGSTPNFFKRYISIIKSSGAPQAELTISQWIVNDKSESDLKAILNQIENNSVSRGIATDRLNAKLAQGKANFHIHIILDGDNLENSTIDITAMQL